ncbi:MAG: HAD-IIIA family hydrolase [Alphaproteobacteria bacterium]|nr:HAD-IIIA family hydrolase [Alphaproteobacteria bacterium]
MKVVLLDRDGVLSEDRDDYIKHPGELVMIAGAAEAVARLNAAQIKVAVVSNQSAVGRRIISVEMMERINAKLRSELADGGARLDLLLTCTDAPWAASERRKPGPGMLREALLHFRAAAHETVMIGDQLSDLQAARAAQVAPILVRTGKGALVQAQGLPQDILPVSVYDSAALAVEALLADR